MGEKRRILAINKDKPSESLGFIFDVTEKIPYLVTTGDYNQGEVASFLENLYSN